LVIFAEISDGPPSTSLSGPSADIQRLKDMLQAGTFVLSDADFEQLYAGDVNTLACALKQWISELASPVIPHTMYDEALRTVQQATPDAVTIKSVYAFVRELPQVNQRVLLAFVELMSEVLAHAELNKMTPSNLAICFAPGLFQGHEKDPMAFLKNMQHEKRFCELLLSYPPSRDDLRAAAVEPAPVPVGLHASAPSINTLGPLSRLSKGLMKKRQDKKDDAKAPTKRHSVVLQSSDNVTFEPRMPARRKTVNVTPGVRRQSEPVGSNAFDNLGTVNGLISPPHLMLSPGGSPRLPSSPPPCPPVNE